MKRKVLMRRNNPSHGRKEAISYLVNIPPDLARDFGLEENDRDVDIRLVENKLIIEKL